MRHKHGAKEKWGSRFQSHDLNLGFDNWPVTRGWMLNRWLLNRGLSV